MNTIVLLFLTDTLVR